MRIYFAISIVIHAAIVLWFLLGPGARALDPASAQPILVDLVSPNDAQSDSESSKSEEAKSEETKSEETKSQESKPETAKPEPSKPDLAADQKSAPRNDPQFALQDSAEERAATAARLTWMLGLPTDTAASLAAPPSENKTNLTSEEVAQLKARVSKCWVVPPGVPSTPGFDVLIRIALNPNGTLGAKPELIRAPASLAGPPLVDSAKQALQKCQPYAGLPADKYKDWKILDLTFTAAGPAGLSGPPAAKSSVNH
jgi:hypothetical protein